MTAQQINELRQQFKGLNPAQQSQFIANLRQKAQTANNPALTNFLNECIQNQQNTANFSGGQAMYSKNKVAKMVVGVAVIHIIASIILVIISAMIEDFQGIFTWIMVGVIGFIFIYALAEIIQILHDIRAKK